MSDRIKVPEEMLEAAKAEWPSTFADPILRDSFIVGMIFACQHISEHPIVPTDEQMGELMRECPDKTYLRACDRFAAFIDLWQRRMFRAPEPEVPESVQNILEELLETLEISQRGVLGESVMKAILEAYRRGLNASAPKAR